MFLGAIEARLARAARRSALAGVGAIFATVGIGFLTVATWLVLSELRDATFAAMVLGMIYLGVGTIALGFAFSRPRPALKAPPAPEQNPIAALMPAFLAGFEQGRQMRTPKNRD